jgi:hypothetical protein
MLLPGSLIGLLFDPEDGGGTFLGNSLNILLSYTSQKIVFFITTAVRIPNPISICKFILSGKAAACNFCQEK